MMAELLSHVLSDSSKLESLIVWLGWSVEISNLLIEHQTKFNKKLLPSEENEVSLTFQIIEVLKIFNFEVWFFFHFREHTSSHLNSTSQWHQKWQYFTNKFGSGGLGGVFFRNWKPDWAKEGGYYTITGQILGKQGSIRNRPKRAFFLMFFHEKGFFTIMFHNAWSAESDNRTLKRHEKWSA